MGRGEAGRQALWPRKRGAGTVEPEDWNRRYAGDELVWTAEPNRFLVAEADGLTPGRALDLAAGEGRNAVWLAERGWEVDAVDFADAGLQKGRRLAGRRGVEVHWIRADLERYAPERRAYDLVIIFYLHLPWARLRPVLRRASSAVAAGGTFLLVGHDRTNLEQGHGGPKNAQVLYGADDVAGELGGLQVVEAAIRRRAVETDSGQATALDCLVRARRGEATGRRAI